MAVSMKINPADYLTPIFGPVIAPELAKVFVWEFYMYGLRVWKPHEESEYVNTGVSTKKVIEGGETSANLNLVATKIKNALYKVDQTWLYNFTHPANPVVPPVPTGTVAAASVVTKIGDFSVPAEVYQAIVGHIAAGNVVLAIKTLRIQVQCGLYEAKCAIDSLVASLQTLSPKEAEAVLEVPPKATKSNKVENTVVIDKVEAPAPHPDHVQIKVKLRDASAIGQPVNGTSPSSTYYCVALSPTIKVALRLQGDGSLSVRVEGNPTTAEKEAMTELGLDSSGTTHWSTHFGLAGVAVERVAGAFLMALGTEFTAKVESATQLKKAIKC